MYFRELYVDRQVLLVAPAIKSIMSHCCLFSPPDRMQPESDQFTFCNGVVLHRNQCQQIFGDWLGAIIEFSRALHDMDLDIQAFACLCALTLVNGESY